MYIYKTINLINKKLYIGKDSHDKNDLKAKKYLGSGKILGYAIKKYGRENFRKEIIDECDTIYELNHLEKFWIAFYHSQNKRIGYNIAEGGDGGKLLEVESNLILEILGNRTQKLKELKTNLRKIIIFDNVDDCLNYNLEDKKDFKVYYKKYYR